MNSLFTVRWKLREWLKLNKKAPLWLFKYSNGINSEVIKAIEALSEFLRPNLDNNLSDDLIQSCYDDVEPANYDLNQLIKKDTFVLFKNLVSTLDIQLDSDYVQNIIDNDMSEIIEYVFSVMPEEIYDWEEFKVDSEIVRWFYDKHEIEEKQRIEEERKLKEDKEKRMLEKERQKLEEEKRMLEKERLIIEQEKKKIGSKVVPNNTISSNNKDIINKIEKVDPEELKRVIIEILSQNEEIQEFFKDYF